MSSKEQLSPEAYARVLAGNRARQRTAVGKKNHQKANDRYRRRHRQKQLAHEAVAYALRTGRLIRKPCEECGNQKSEAHHDDYEKPLDVRWLCDTHHKQTHAILALNRKDTLQ